MSTEHLNITCCRCRWRLGCCRSCIYNPYHQNV